MTDEVQATILIVEDESAIADTIAYALETEGFATRRAQLGREAIDTVRDTPVDLVILDIGLPDVNGFEVCKTLRSEGPTPVIILTSRSSEIDRVVGLEIGADDYVVKPFSPRELAARVKVVLRRSRGEAPGYAASPFTHDAEGKRIAFHRVRLDLTLSEYRILQLLLEHPRRVFSRREIQERTNEVPDMSQERSVDTHIKALRGKLRAVSQDSDPIRTHRGLGYSLDPDA